MKLGGSFTMQFAILLHQILLKLIVCFGVSNFIVHLHEAFDSFLSSHRYNAYAHQVIEGVIKTLSTLILNDHVMHDHTSSHDTKGFFIPESRWSSHNSKLGLQNPKSPLNIFPSCSLCIVKDEFFLTLGF